MFKFASERLNAFKQEALQFQAGRFGGDYVLWQDCVGGALFAESLARASIQEFDLVPMLFSRLEEPGVKQRILDQWAEVPAARHDRLTMRLLGPNSEFRNDILDIDDHGGNISERLLREVWGIKELWPGWTARSGYMAHHTLMCHVCLGRAGFARGAIP